jgi:amino acid permease
MSLTTLVVNIVADLCPHGMLPLAYGISQGGPTGVVPALVLLGIFGSMSAYTMTSFANMAAETKSKSIGDLWAQLVDPKTKWIADAAVFSLCFGCCIFYSAFAGDIFGALSSAMGVKGVLGKRWVALGLLSSLCLLPLCLLEDLSALQFSSLLGVGGIAYTLVFHALRLFDGSYTPGSALLNDMGKRMQPSWPRGTANKFSLFKLNSGALVLVNMLCVAYLAHYNAINYYNELENTSPERYRRAVFTGFGIAASVFAGMMLIGYSLFGSVAQPLILNNFHRTADHLATGARLATGLAITFAYPLMFNGVKSSMFALMEHTPPAPSGSKTSAKKVDASAKKQRRTMAIVAALGAITAVAFKCGEEDVSVVLGIVGSVLGCGVAYVLPGYLGLIRQRARKAKGLPNARPEILANHALVGLGTLFGGLGVALTLQEAAQGHGHH